MKPLHFAALAGSLLLMAVILLVTGQSGSNPATVVANQAQPRLVTVVGQADIRPKPDIVALNIAVRTHGVSAYEAETSHVAAVKRIGTGMVQAGSDDAPSDGGQIYLSPIHPMPTVTEFEARSVLRATVSKLDKVHLVVDAAFNSGAAGVESMTFGVEQLDKVRQTAIAQAIASATTRAKALLKEAGETLGAVRSIEVLEDAPPAPTTTAGALEYHLKVKVIFEF